MIFRRIKSGFLFAVLLFSAFVSAQVAAVHFTTYVPLIKENNNGIFLAGSFNYWHAGDSLYRMQKVEEGIYSIILPVFAGHVYEYKYTRGKWENVETALDDSEIHNRRFVSSDQLEITDTVVKWKHPKPVSTTVSPQVQKINAMKDSVMGKLEPELNRMKQLFLPYIENLLSDKPNHRVNRQFNKKVVKKIGGIYAQISQLFWDVFATLTPDQKKMIRDTISQPAAKTDIINAVLNALKAATEKSPPS